MHYHIHWSGSKVDWERFSTRQEAEQTASQLARPGETFTVKSADDTTCMHCLKTGKRALAIDKRRDAEASS
ncbi:MAG: hypothetical protein ACRD8A_13605 [Candidatus Acidiferrales bacterium]